MMQKFLFGTLSLLLVVGCSQSSPVSAVPTPQISGVNTGINTSPGNGTTASIGNGTTAGVGAITTATPISCGALALNFEISRTITRSTAGLTEGFSFEDGVIYESTGLISGHGPSVINKIDPSSGAVTKLYSTPAQNFGEGLVRVGAYFYQLTYQDGNIYQYTSDGTATGTHLIATFDNPLSEGWGLTTDGNDLIASDGSNFIYRIDPTTLKVLSKISVLDPSGKAITGLNELEYVDGQIYANIFPTNRMVRFDATSGCQTAEIDLTSLQAKLDCASDSEAIDCTIDSVTNGIAYDPNSSTFYLTGKSWPMIYQGVFQ
jgi:glutamine cyclotransferase